LLVDWDDPENRIAELERQQADANAAAAQPPSRRVTGGPISTARGELTADDVHNVAFSTPPRGKRGYDVGEVEAFRRRLEEHLRNPQAVGGLTAAEVDSVAFSKAAMGKRGYDQHEVDAFLDRVVQHLKRTNGFFEQQLTPDVGSQPGFPAATSGFRGHTGRRSKPRRYEWAFLPLAILAAAFSLVAFGIGVYDVHGYRVGTPTTAKVVSCVGGRRTASVACTGTWSVGGKSYAGRIEGDGKGYKVGSSLDVRVRGGSAYTATSGDTWFITGTWAGVFAVGGFLVFFFARRRPTDAAPTAGRHSRN
jgi:DivIVA domain-containing protein